MATLDELAALVGVSKATASRAFSRPETVRSTTRERILAKARDIGYSPDPLARSLATGRRDTIGLLVPNLANPIYPPGIQAARVACRRDARTLFVLDRDPGEPDDVAAVDDLARKVDGLILAMPRMRDEEVLQVAQTIPTVLMNRVVPGVPSQVVSAREGMDDAVRHLRDLGHKRIAYLGSKIDTLPARERLDAVGAAAKAHGVALTVLAPVDIDISAGTQAAASVAASRTSAVICYNDLVALGVVRGLRAIGLQVPSDMSIVGHDDTWAMDFVEPPLTTIHIPSAQSFESLVQMLFDRLAGRPVPPSPVRIPCQLVIRASTGPPFS